MTESKEKRKGEIKKKIQKVLKKVLTGESTLESSELTLSETLHNEVGGSANVKFCNVFRELHFLLEYGNLSDDMYEFVKKIYWDSNYLDRLEYHNRRRVH